MTILFLLFLPIELITFKERDYIHKIQQSRQNTTIKKE